MILNNIKLTANEAAILKAFPGFQYVSDSSLADIVGLGLGTSTWTWSFTDDAAAAAGISVKAVKGVISSLVKKGLVTCQNDGPADERTVTVTDAGLALVVALQDGKPADETTAEQPEAPVSGTFAVAWPEAVGKIFFPALGRDGATILASAHGLDVEAVHSRMHLTVTVTGDHDKAMVLAATLPHIFTDANERLKVWRKTSPNYKCHDLKTIEGRRDAWTVEQQWLRDFCTAVAGTFTNDQLAADGVQAGLAYANDEEA